MSSFQTYAALNVTTATGRVIKSGPGVLAGVSLNKTAVGTVTVLDGATTIGTIAAGELGGMYLVGPTAFASLKTTMTTAAEDVTFIYQ